MSNDTIKCFKFDDKIFLITEEEAKQNGYASAMENANYHFDLPDGAWFGNRDDKSIKPNHWEWIRGNFWD